jgi:hypothetical protein
MEGHRPHDPDGGKACHKSEECYLLFEQLIEQCEIAYYTTRHLDTQHEQGDGDGEDAIAKGFQATCIFVIFISIHSPSIQGGLIDDNDRINREITWIICQGVYDGTHGAFMTLPAHTSSREDGRQPSAEEYRFSPSYLRAQLTVENEEDVRTLLIHDDARGAFMTPPAHTSSREDDGQPVSQRW